MTSRVKRTLDRLAYASLVLDICIAIITSLSLFGVSQGEHLLIPINYLLTSVVILSVAMFVVLVVLKFKESHLPPDAPKSAPVRTHSEK